MDMWKCHSDHKQMPIPDEDSIVFWEACRRQRLVIQQCAACQHYRFPPSPRCPSCQSPRWTWQEDVGQGEIETFCVYHSALAGPAWEPELPYVVGVIRLRQTGVQLLSQIQCHDPRDVAIGQPVQVTFEPVSERVTLPKFVLANAPPTASGA